MFAFIIGKKPHGGYTTLGGSEKRVTRLEDLKVTKDLTFKLSALAGAMLFAAAGAQAYTINPDGIGGVGNFNVAAIDPLPGNVISSCLACRDATGAVTTNINLAGVGSVIQTFGHATVGAFTNSANVAITGTGLGSAYEWSLVFGFTETIGTNIPGVFSKFFNNAPGVGSNFFELYYDPSKDSNMLQGTGFTNGTKILAGTINGFDPISGKGASSFGVTSPDGGPLDQTSDGNQYPAIHTVGGIGGGDFVANVNFKDNNFFIDPLLALNVRINTSLVDPFDTANPSSCFTSSAGAPAPTFVGAGSGGGGPCGGGVNGTLGAINGNSGAIGDLRNFMQQADANVPLPNTVPEPTSLALIGLGALAVGAAKRRRNAEKAA